MIITELDHTMVAELYVMREVLEGTAAGLAARHASDVEIAMLREITDRDKKNDKSLIRRAANNRLFHETLHRCSHNRYLLRTLNTLRESMALLGTTLSLSGRSQTALAEHEAVVSAIERHDAVAAEEALRAHIRAAYRSRLSLRMRRKIKQKSMSRCATVIELVKGVVSRRHVVFFGCRQLWLIRSTRALPVSRVPNVPPTSRVV